MPIVRTATRTALGAQRLAKDLARAQQIVQVLARHGFGWVVDRVELPGIGFLRRMQPDDLRAAPTPERLVAVMRDLGPTFVKVGQILSTRDDLLPRAWTEAFSQLQDDVGPMPWETVAAQIEGAFGGPAGRFFEWIDEAPLATASIAQVHRARFPTGEEVVLKVQRPGVRLQMERDLGILQALAETVEGQFPEIAAADLPGLAAELRRRVAEECDFRTEAANIERFARNFAENPNLVFPAVYDGFVTPSVFVMAFLDGVKVSRSREAGYDMRIVGERFLAAAFQMLLEDGFFHADLHPGNMLVLPGEKLGVLDCGLAGRLTDEMREHLITIFFGVQRRDYRTVARVFWEVARKDGPVDYDRWERDVFEIVEREVAGKAMAELHFGELIRQLTEGAIRHGVRIPAGYSLFWKALLTTQGVANSLMPEVDPLEAMVPYLQRMAARLYGKERLQEEALYWVLSFRYAAKRLPMLAGQFVTDLQEGRARIRVLNESDERVLKVGRDGAEQVSRAILSAGLFIAGSLALAAPGPTVGGFPVPAAACYVLAGLMLLLPKRG